MAATDKTGCVLVLYHPDPEEVPGVIACLLEQTDILCIVDNTPEADHSELFAGNSRIIYIPNRKNSGIAAAQNQGISILMEQKCDWIAFSDQDTEIAPDTIAKITAVYNDLESRGVPVGVVGTCPVNKLTGEPYKLDITEYTRMDLDSGHVMECSAVMSSVSLMSRNALLEAGGFDESLFIDFVDYEWCWRAKRGHGLRSFIAEDVKVMHMLGNFQHKVGNRNLSIGSSTRIYYQFRNYLWLMRRGYAPGAWLRKNGFKFLVKIFYYPLLVKPRLAYARNILRGIRAGLGRRPEAVIPESGTDKLPAKDRAGAPGRPCR